MKKLIIKANEAIINFGEKRLHDKEGVTALEGWITEEYEVANDFEYSLEAASPFLDMFLDKYENCQRDSIVVYVE